MFARLERVRFLLPAGTQLEVPSFSCVKRVISISPGILRPNYVWIDERDFFDHQAPGKKREETNAQSKCSCFEEMPWTNWRSLRNRDAAQLQSTPRRDAHAADSERGAEAPAQLL